MLRLQVPSNEKSILLVYSDKLVFLFVRTPNYILHRLQPRKCHPQHRWIRTLISNSSLNTGCVEFMIRYERSTVRSLQLRNNEVWCVRLVLRRFVCTPPKAIQWIFLSKWFWDFRLFMEKMDWYGPSGGSRKSIRWGNCCKRSLCKSMLRTRISQNNRTTEGKFARTLTTKWMEWKRHRS